MIKPIVYRHIEEKEVLERKLMASIPNKKRASTSKALMDIFAHPKKKLVTSKSRKK
jgi:hypothetical protein